MNRFNPYKEHYPERQARPDRKIKLGLTDGIAIGTTPTSVTNLTIYDLDGEPADNVWVEEFEEDSVVIETLDNMTLKVKIHPGELVGANSSGQIVSQSRDYAGAFLHENSTALTIEKVGIPHALHGLTVGHLSAGWTYYAGKSITVTAWATSDAGAKTQLTCAGHGLKNGDVITIANTTSYDGIYNIEQVATNTFVIADAYVADEGAKVCHIAAYLMSPRSTATGVYLACGMASCTPANSNDVFEFEFYLDTTELTNTESQIKLGSTGDYACATTQGIIEYTAGQRFWAKTENLTGSGDITIRNCNFTLVRIGG